MGGHEYQPLPRFADLALPDDGPPVETSPRPGRRALAHPLTGLWPPWSAEWASGHTDTSPWHPWHLLGAVTRIGLGNFIAREALRAQLATLRSEGPDHG